MGVMQPDISDHGRPGAAAAACLHRRGGQRISLSNDLDPNGNYAMFVLRPWNEPLLSTCRPIVACCRIYVNQTHGLTPVFVALEPTRDLEHQLAGRQVCCRSGRCVLPAPARRAADYWHDAENACDCLHAAARADLRLVLSARRWPQFPTIRRSPASWPISARSTAWSWPT